MNEVTWTEAILQARDILVRNGVPRVGGRWYKARLHARQAEELREEMQRACTKPTSAKELRVVMTFVEPDEVFVGLVQDMIVVQKLYN